MICVLLLFGGGGPFQMMQPFRIMFPFVGLGVWIVSNDADTEKCCFLLWLGVWIVSSDGDLEKLFLSQFMPCAVYCKYLPIICCACVQCLSCANMEGN